jgi:hypothetical protein
LAGGTVDKPGVKKRMKFDEAKFFIYLSKNSNPRLLCFLRSIDKRAYVELTTYIIRYLRRSEEAPVFSERRRRLTETKKALSMTIASLRNAAAKYRRLAKIEFRGVGSPITGAPTWPEGEDSFAGGLESEAARLSGLLKKCKRLYNEKRFGVSGNHLWLVLLQEFVAAWTEQELGRARLLRPADIADLITAGKVTLGWRADRAEADPELISKAILKFRSNPTNAWISGEAAKSYAQERCRSVRLAPYLLGIEIYIKP